MSTYYLLGIVLHAGEGRVSKTKSLLTFFSFPFASTKEMPQRVAVSLAERRGGAKPLSTQGELVVWANMFSVAVSQ